MNNLKTTDTGRFPFVLDDLRWSADGIRDAIKGMFSHLGITASESFKISGCVVTINGNIYSWTEGYICLGGEILKVMPGSLITPAGTWQVGQKVYWSLAISYDASGSKVFENGVTHEAYEIRNGVLVFGTPAVNQQGQSDYMPHDAQYIEQKWLALISSADLLDIINISDLVSEIQDIEDSWVVNATLLNGWTNFGNGYPNLSFKKDVFNVLHFKGFVQKGVPDTTPIIILPVAYRPIEKRRVMDKIININGEIIDTSGASAVSFEFSIKL